jgi:hypothetical protein
VSPPFRLAALLLGLGVAPVLGQGFYLPAAAPSAGQDEFRASDGTSCRSTMDGTKRVEVGSFATGGRTEYGSTYSLPGYVSTPAQGNVGVYGRYTWSLDGNPDRMDCKKLYELELEKKRLEVELLKRSLVSADQKLDNLKSQPVRKVKGAPPP